MSFCHTYFRFKPKSSNHSGLCDRSVTNLSAYVSCAFRLYCNGFKLHKSLCQALPLMSSRQFCRRHKLLRVRSSASTYTERVWKLQITYWLVRQKRFLSRTKRRMTNFLSFLGLIQASNRIFRKKVFPSLSHCTEKEFSYKKNLFFQIRCWQSNKPNYLGL